MAPNYWDYLRLNDLLSLQAGLDEDESDQLPDELHFIIVHQAFELWFKLMIRSLRQARDQLHAEYVPDHTMPSVVHHLRRVNAILHHSVQQFRVMETLTPQGFLSFRDRLSPASGFQSYQMRVIEVLMGLDEAQRIRYGKEDPLDHIRKLSDGSEGGAAAWAAIQQVRSEKSLLEALNAWLYRTPIQGSGPDDEGDPAVVDAFLTDYLATWNVHQDQGLERLVEVLGEEAREGLTARVNASREAGRRFLLAEDVLEEHRARVKRCRAALVFIESYRDLPLMAWPRLLLDLFVEMEEHVLLFRNRHARMVERLIGRRIGTGGSGGVEYLDKTLSYRVFGDLWTVRTVLLRKELLPELQAPERYDFATR